MDGDRGHLESALESPTVQSLDVLEDVLELEIPSLDLPVGESMEHKGIVRVRAVGHADELSGHGIPMVSEA